MGSTEEPERKRRHLSSNSTPVSPPPLKKPYSMAPVTEEKKVDATMLQYQNQKLVQQLEVQKTEIQALEDKFNQLRSRQASFDETLMAVNRCWNELVEDLELLVVRAQPGNAAELKVLQPDTSNSNDKTKASETFLQRLLDTGATESSTLDESIAIRRASTGKTIKYLVETINLERAKNEELSLALRSQLSPDDAGEMLKKVDEDLRSEVQALREAMDALHIKHKSISSKLQDLEDCHIKDQAEIARLTGELEDTLAQLETSRRKLAALRTQKDESTTPHSSKESGERDCQRSFKEIRELECCIEEAKTLAAQRLAELQEAHQTKLNLTEQVQRLQDSHVAEQKILSSRPYLLLLDQLKFYKAETDKYHQSMERMQAERDVAYRIEKEAALKAEAEEDARRAVTLAEARISELETRLRQCMADRDELQLRVEELNQLTGRKDTVAELKVMISTLHKEMGMMQTQLNKYKEAAHEVCALRAEVHSLATVLERKEIECDNLSKRVAEHSSESVSLLEKIRKLQETEQEMKLILDMYEKESPDSRDVMELQQAECRARAQVQRLKEALDEHSLELRVKAANEAEAVCQQRLAAAEAEIADLRQQFYASEREKLELVETIKSKNEESEAYITEIETIGQAYEDMQTQNQRLLQQISERDDYNTKLVAEGLKAKQLQTSLIAEKQLISGKMQHAASAAELQKQRAARFEEQLRTSVDQLAKAADENRQLSLSLELAKRKMMEAERESQTLRSALETADKDIQERGNKALQMQAELERERFEKRRLLEEVAALNAKAARLHAQESGGLVERLQQEIKEYRALLKCSVCDERQKEVVITKCYHLFCSPCIQRNLELRHRKCPGCGVTFGHNDVHSVYI